MDNWIFVKEEPLDSEFYEVKSEYCDTSDSYLIFGSEQSCDIKNENEEFKNVDKESDDDAWKAESLDHPELSVRLVPLEYSKNQKVKKNLESPFSKSEETTTIDLKKYVKTESIELETLTEDTIAQSSLETLYASPWDFVKDSNRFSQIHSTNQNTEKKDKHRLVTSSELPQTAQEGTEKIVKNFAFQNGDESVNETEKLNIDPSEARAKEIWECDLCGKIFDARKKIHQHMQTHYPKTFVCDKCPRSYSYRSTLRRHAETHVEGYEKKKTNYYPSVRQKAKIQVKKPKIDKQVDIEEANKLYECDICHERFEKKSTMRIHIEFLHIELYGNQPLTKQIKQKLKRPFKCKKCDKKFTQSSHLYRHEAIHLSDKTYKCEKCDVNFKRKSSLSRHLLFKHSEKYLERSKERYGEKEESRKKVKATLTEFVCKICKKSFKTNYDLRRHCVVHDGRKPYECDICKKQFSLKSYIYAHILTHDNWRPYQCEKCPKFYRRKSSLQRHVDLNHSGKKKNTCYICFKSYKHLPSYNAHMKNHKL